MDTKVLLQQYQNACARLGDLEMHLQIMDELHDGKRKELLTQIDDTRRVLKSLRLTIDLQNLATRNGGAPTPPNDKPPSTP